MTRLLALPLPFTAVDQPLRSFRAKSSNRFKLFAFLSIVRHEKMLNFIKKRRVEIRQSLYIAMRRGLCRDRYQSVVPFRFSVLGLPRFDNA